MKRAVTIFLAGLMLAISTPACYGKFALASKLKSSVGGINNKWVQSFVVFLTLVVPIVLWVTYLLDSLIFNMIEFWTGSNPLTVADFDENGTAVRTIKKDDVTLKMTYLDFGSEMKIEIMNRGYQEGETIHILRSQPGVLFTQDVTGELRQVTQESLGINDQQFARAQDKVNQLKLVHSF
ncbi:MAG: DUF3332 family protein [Leptospiraceae bacterium]|nr:DUF3332 family protein [Leptospiraceae bacterium]